LHYSLGTPKAGVDIVQQIKATNVKEDQNYQHFGLSTEGHIYLINKPSLVLGIKEGFFSRREGLHVHLQLVDKRHLDRKEQRWDFVEYIEKLPAPKRSGSTSTIGSIKSNIASKIPSVHQIKEDGKCTPFFNTQEFIWVILMIIILLFFFFVFKKK
jgi:hypothetical protein